MTPCEQPRVENIPEPLRGSELDTFAHYTVSVRMPNIARRTIEANYFTPEMVTELEALILEMPYRPLRFLQDEEAPDTQAWNQALLDVTGMNWLETPWFLCEMYFYRRILEATGYFRPGPFQGLDPYLREKQSGLEQSVGQIAALSERLEEWRNEKTTPREHLAALIHGSVWGNQADLSVWPAGTNQPSYSDSQLAEEHLLADDTNQAIQLFEQVGKSGRRVDILLDNAGFELVNDLALVDFVLENGLAGEVRLHVKPYPTYVSDATETDIRHTVEFLENNRHTASSAFGKRLRAGLDGGRLQVTSSLFWTSPYSGWQLPGGLRQELAGSGLIVSKGDAHYRRWLGDRHWPFDTPLDTVLCYAPAPLLLLRTCKSEVAIGLDAKQTDRIFHQDPRWLTDGLWAVVQSYRL